MSFLSCAGLRERIRPERDIRMAAEIRFDPLAFPGDDAVITGKSGRKVTESVSTDDYGRAGADSAILEESSRTTERILFRVQVYSTKSFDDAQQYSSSIKSMFPEGVAVDYQVPYYKVQVGQFNNSSDGQLFLEKVKQLGFENAWLVRIVQ
jgi:hypothetical protein